MVLYSNLCRIYGKAVPSAANLQALRWPSIGTRSVIGKFTLYTLGGTAVGGISGGLLLPVIGFGSGGVTAGTIAAAWHSGIGTVASGSAFALMQSLGATGFGNLLFGSIGAGVGALTTFALRKPKSIANVKP